MSQQEETASVPTEEAAAATTSTSSSTTTNNNNTTTNTLANTTKKTSPPAPATTEDKVKIHFVAVGSAPHMKRSKFQIAASSTFATVQAYLRKILKLAHSQAIFLYCSSAFCPGPTELVGDLRDCFAVRDELVIHYRYVSTNVFM